MNYRTLLLLLCISGICVMYVSPRAFAQDTQCTNKKYGDADCTKNTDGFYVTILDYAIWLSEYIGGCSSTTLDTCGEDSDQDRNAMDANFNYPGSFLNATDEKITIFDFVVWRQGYLAQITPTPAPFTGKGIWISEEEIQEKKTDTEAWYRLKNIADSDIGTSNLYFQESGHPQRTLAVALVAAKLGDSAVCKDKNCRAKAADAIKDIQNDTFQQKNEEGTGDGRALGLGRNLMAYVIAADVINLKQYRPQENAEFIAFIRATRDRTDLTECTGLKACHEKRPNNWGAMAGASRIAVDLYLQDQQDLLTAINVFKGYIGDTGSYSSFTFNKLASEYACQPLRPLNPANCKIIPPGCDSIHDYSGAPIDDARRDQDDGPPHCPLQSHYPWGTASAMAAQAEMLYRAGYDSYNWQDQAILRAQQFAIREVNEESQSSATNWLPWLIKKRYGQNSISYTPLPNGGGRLMDWTDWTHN